MAITRVSKLMFMGVALALLPLHVLGQGGGGGGGGGDGGGGSTAPPTEVETSFTQPSLSTSMTATGTSDTTAAEESTATDDTTSSTPSTAPPLPTSGTSVSTGTATSSSTAPPLPTSGTSASTGTATSSSTAPPLPTSGTSASTATVTPSSMASTPPPYTSDDRTLPPGDFPGNSTDEEGGPGGNGTSSTDEIYFPSQYTAECDHYGEDAHYEVELRGSGESMVRQARSDTGCSNHVNWGVDKGMDYHFPGRIVSSNASIPAYPMMIGDNGTTDLSTTNGQVAILVNGVAMFSAWATEPVTDYNSTAFYLEGDTLDACGGHATTEGWYHYHGTPGCLEEQVMIGEGLTVDDHSPFLGWSYDGFPMYGHLGPGGIEMRACDTNGADETYCLDTCSGYEGEMPDVDDFTYRYYLTCGYDESFFPMTINCFRGCCPDGIECDDTVEACDDTAELGYSSDYQPELLYNYTDMYEIDVLSGVDGDYINSSTLVNCTIFYDVTLFYTVEQTSIGEFSVSPTPSPSPGETSGSSRAIPFFSAASVLFMVAFQWTA